MRTTKLGAVLASLAVTAGTAAMLGGAPAQADTATQVTLNLGGYASVKAPYGIYLGTLSGQISAGTDPVNVGSATLQRRLPGKHWRNVKTDAVVPSVEFGRYGSKARGNVKYRVHYLGGTDATTATTYHASYSNVVTVRTAWNMHEQVTCQPKCRMFGKLGPKARHHKIVIQVKHHGWKRYRVIRTNRRSHWSVSTTPSRGNGTLYRAIVAATKHEIRSTSRICRFVLVPLGRPTSSISQR